MTFVVLALQENINQQLMKERSRLTARFVLLALQDLDTRKEHLNVHIATVHEWKQLFQCEICDYRNEYEQTCCYSSWRKKVYQMQICDNFFTGMENLNRHVASVHKGFTQKTILNSHITSVHEGIKPVKCRVCDHIFSK